MGFLSNALFAFIPLAAAFGAALAGIPANRILHSGAKLPEFKIRIPAAVVFFVFVFVGPLLSSLAYAEAWAVMSRLRREGILADAMIEAASATLDQGTWRRLHSQPDWQLVRSLAVKWPLGGADLWHLAAAKSLQDELPELRLLTFDVRLKGAAEGENLSL